MELVIKQLTLLQHYELHVRSISCDTCGDELTYFCRHLFGIWKCNICALPVTRGDDFSPEIVASEHRENTFTPSTPLFFFARVPAEENSENLSRIVRRGAIPRRRRLGGHRYLFVRLLSSFR